MRRAKFKARHTKIVCTIGPATSPAPMIEKLIKAGMNVARLNLSHSTHEAHTQIIRLARKTSGKLGVNVAVMIDIPGPKYRTGKLSGGQAVLKKGARLSLTTRNIEGNETLVPVNLPTLYQDVRIGDTIFINDGAIQLKVVKKADDEVVCRVTVGGLLTEGRGLVIPGRRTGGPYMTESLKKHVLFAVGQNPDFIALSFVRSVDDVRSVKALLGEKNAGIPVIVKIECGEAVANFDRILENSDGIMVARGDLGVHIPIEKVPLIQKDIIKKCNRAGKPVITATEMLESMVNSARPTRAEVTDVANAIYDGTDAVMLSTETSVGKYPVQSVKMMARIASEVEDSLPYDQILAERGKWLEQKTEDLISYNACLTAHNLGAVAIVAFTQSGTTAGRVSKYRSSVPILAITSSSIVVDRLLLNWGVYPYEMAEATSMDELFISASALSRKVGLAKSGDLIVITGGLPIGVTGTTNLLKVEKVK